MFHMVLGVKLNGSNDFIDRCFGDHETDHPIITLVLLKVIFFIFGLTKRPFRDYLIFFMAFLSKS